MLIQTFSEKVLVTPKTTEVYGPKIIWAELQE